MTTRNNPFDIIRKQTIAEDTERKKQGRPKVIATKQSVEATKVTTVFDPNHAGYNKLDSLHICPICNIQMLTATLTTVDGRIIPTSYCLQHRINLPLPNGNT